MYMYAHILVLFNAHMTNNSPCVLNIREKEARVFICGDYAFLCVIHGLSGASGMYGVTCTLHAPTKLAKTAKPLACSPAALNHEHTCTCRTALLPLVSHQK